MPHLLLRSPGPIKTPSVHVPKVKNNFIISIIIIMMVMMMMMFAEPRSAQLQALELRKWRMETLLCFWDKEMMGLREKRQQWQEKQASEPFSTVCDLIILGRLRLSLTDNGGGFGGPFLPIWQHPLHVMPIKQTLLEWIKPAFWRLLFLRSPSLQSACVSHSAADCRIMRDY